MDRIMPIIEKETGGISYKSHRFCYDSSPKIGIEYDPENEHDKWFAEGESEKNKDKNISVKNLTKDLENEESIFKYFLDGSRHTYKIDDISYEKNVFPVIAGQIGVGCCSRKNYELKKEIFERKLVIALPDKAREDEWDSSVYFQKIKKAINANPYLTKIGVSFDEILTYSSSQLQEGITFETLGISRIQSAMIEMEKNVVAKLVANNRINDREMLIKDGSLEYQKLSAKTGSTGNDLSDKKFRERYTNVIGVSKSFNPTNCYTSENKSDSRRVARLKTFERTPVNAYASKRAGDVWFAVWYVRLHDAKYSNNIFDGVVKVEKILGVRENDEDPKPLPTEYVDYITANLLKERNPVCYGADARWANHIYPMYLTESFVKSQYLSSNLFMELF